MPAAGRAQTPTMLHSVMPPEVVWWEAGAEPELVMDGLRRIWLRTGPDGCRRIERIASTEPRDYLDPSLQPGAIWKNR
jgi:hypothetical protein